MLNLNYYDLIEKNSITLPDEGSAREFHIKEIELNNVGDIEFSIVMPVFSQCDIICGNIEAALRHTKGPSELILILDYCVDGSEEKVLNFFENYNNEHKNFKSVTIVKHEKFPIFEASCEVYDSGSLDVFDPLSTTNNNQLWHRGYPINLRLIK